jgi:calcium-dependent protein kinase
LSRQERDNLKESLEKLLTIEHNNFTRIKEYYQDRKFYYIISEYIKGGLMMEYILESKNYEEKMVADIIKQILSAIIYSQTTELFHKDMRLENFMIDDALLDIPQIKI